MEIADAENDMIACNVLWRTIRVISRSISWDSSYEINKERTFKSQKATVFVLKTVAFGAGCGI